MTSTQEAEQKTILGEAHATYNKVLCTYAYFKVNDSEMSKDLVQDTFTKTWSYLLRGGKIEGMKSFLYHILNNLIVDEYRKKKNRSTSLDVLIDNGFEPSIDETDRITNALDGTIAVKLIKNLPHMYQKIVSMRYIHDLSLKEMSDITGRTQNSMAVQAHRGLSKLRVLYNHA